MISAFSDFSMPVVYAAVERWEEIIDDAGAAGVSTQALEFALVDAATSDPAATDDVSDAARSTLEAAVEASTDALATQATPDLALQMLIATTT